jgi:hypothetical protein
MLYLVELSPFFPRMFGWKVDPQQIASVVFNPEGVVEI